MLLLKTTFFCLALFYSFTVFNNTANNIMYKRNATFLEGIDTLLCIILWSALYYITH